MPTRQEIIEDLQRIFGDTDIHPTASNYREHGAYPLSSIYFTLESWSHAKELAGVDGELENPRKIDREKLLQDIQRVNNSVMGVVTYADYQEHGQYSVSVLERRFDGWSSARLAAGIEGKPAAHNRVSEEKATQSLRELSSELGRTPRRADVEKHGEFSYAMFERKFGSWNNALVETGFEVNQPTVAETTEIDCDYCGCSMTREVADIESKENVFCSEKCYWEYLSEESPTGKDHPQYSRIGRECEFCGTTLEIKPSVSEYRERVFCNYSCAGKWRSENRSGENSVRWKGGNVEVECEICGGTYEVRQAKADSSRFCSYECLGIHHREVRSGEDNPNWEGGSVEYRGPNWQAQRVHALKRDGYRCVDCGLTQEESRNQYAEALSVHHRTPFREFRTEDETDYQSANRLENLVTLCRSCHKKWEHMPVQYEIDQQA